MSINTTFKNRAQNDYNQFVTFKDYKIWLKEAGAEIRQLKYLLKNAQRRCNYNETCTYQSGLLKLQELYRIYHIAYSLLRGNTMDEIEPNTETPSHIITNSFRMTTYFMDLWNESKLEKQ